MRAVTFSRQPLAQRRAGVEQMLTDDPALFWEQASRRVLQIDDWPMIRLLCDKAQASREDRALPWLVRSWAMPSVIVSDAERPERDAIEAISGKPAVQLLRSMVFGLATDAENATQLAAWTVLVRIDSHDMLRQRIADSPNDGSSQLVWTLRRVSPVVDVLPADRLAVAYMMRLATYYPEAQWQRWARWRATHANDGPETISLRHLIALLHRDAERDDWRHADWLMHIERRLAGRRHASRGDGAEEDIVVQRRPERFADHAHRLGMADLLVLEQLLDAVDDPGVQRIAFQQADADRMDTTTEYGGAVGWDQRGRPDLQPFDPWIQRHDQAYVASAQCLKGVHLGLAHFHFHTQKYGNAAWTGPGKGDLDFVDAHHVNAIVLTYLDVNTLNVDAYFPGGLIIDLGCMTR